MTEPRTVQHLTDAGTMRALAHPLRLRLLGELRAGGPATVGRLATTTRAAIGSVSYHLGTLAAHGLVVEAPELARDGRERWWRAAADFTAFEPVDVLDDPESRDALGLLRREILRQYVATLEAALDAEPELPREWVAAGFSGDDRLELTVEELAEVHAELDELFTRWRTRTDDAAATSTDRSTARVALIAFAARVADR